MSLTAPPLAARVFATDRRRSAREEVALDTVMANREGQTFGVRIVNMSQHGLLAVSEAPLCERAPVRVEVPTVGWVRADIVWVLGDRVGAAFREPIAPDAFAGFVALFGDALG